MVRGDKVPVYEETLEDNGRFNEQPVLPFNAFGTMAMARGEFDTNSASSQVFFLLKVWWSWRWVGGWVGGRVLRWGAFVYMLDLFVYMFVYMYASWPENHWTRLTVE